MKKSELNQLIKEEVEAHFLKNPLCQQLNKIAFNLFDVGKISTIEYSNIQDILKKLDNQ
jgi:hypothetical protein